MSNLETTVDTYRKISENNSSTSSERHDAREKLYELALEHPTVRDDVLKTFQRIALEGDTSSERSDARDKLYELALEHEAVGADIFETFQEIAVNGQTSTARSEARDRIKKLVEKTSDEPSRGASSNPESLKSIREQFSKEIDKRNQQEGKDVSEEVIEGSDKTANYDAFICHASEDKEEFVSPLANELAELGLNIWYDEFQLEIGDSIRESIDHGLKNSDFGIVILSQKFFGKDWTMYELNGLTSKEIQTDGGILPVWYEINKEEVMKYSPALADKVAVPANSDNVKEVSEKLYSILKE